MFFSVVIVSFNVADIIEKAILSVLGQTYSKKELVIVDGASTDGTIDVLKKYSDRIKWVSEPDNGIYDAMNKALKMASGDFLIFLGSDDHLISLDVLEKVSQFIDVRDKIYYGNVLRPYHNDIYCHKFNKFKLAVKNISHQAIFYPRSVYKTKQYDLKYRIFADYVYNMQLWNKVRFQYVPVVVSFYNETGISSRNKDKAFESDYVAIRRRNLGFLPLVYSAVYHFLREYI